jgi:hypothetical protein
MKMTKELSELRARVAELEEELKQEKIFRNELKLTAMGWQDELENCHLCNCTEFCGNELLEHIKEHERTSKGD